MNKLNRNDLSEIRMTSHEKTSLRARLMEHVENSTVPSPYFLSRKTYRYGTYALVALIVFVIIPTTYVAARSLPGDALYYMGTEILEPIEEILSFTPEKRLEKTLDNAEDRLREMHEILENNSEKEIEEVILVNENLLKKTQKIRKNIIALNSEALGTKIELQKELLTILDSYVEIIENDDRVGHYASTTESIDNIAEEIENDIRDSIENILVGSSPEEVTEEIEKATKDIRDRLENTDRDEERPLDEDERRMLEDDLVATERELFENDPLGALEILIFSDHAVDVSNKVEELENSDTNQEAEDDPTQT